ncbi:uncharacterized protein I303_108064 [Kwoniella dejecticola CBS 10117]|uniref:Uncharacterized protein n=1 Tax=Kwoniella dejecticola CBS 10117 TaxID=1296121 RepID=A0A1A5ZWF3_9TREE|nr:uncharacterized protein I303_08054 [Kwoniella dejecticola CBS 10117]OBR82140.1 hypothetical protein I303_08054 [Kwoniella dejecticola CBS 10117]
MPPTMREGRTESDARFVRTQEQVPQSIYDLELTNSNSRSSGPSSRSARSAARTPDQLKQGQRQSPGASVDEDGYLIIDADGSAEDGDNCSEMSFDSDSELTFVEEAQDEIGGSESGHTNRDRNVIAECRFLTRQIRAKNDSSHWGVAIPLGEYTEDCDFLDKSTEGHERRCEQRLREVERLRERSKNNRKDE